MQLRSNISPGCVFSEGSSRDPWTPAVSLHQLARPWRSLLRHRTAWLHTTGQVPQPAWRWAYSGTLQVRTQTYTRSTHSFCTDNKLNPWCYCSVAAQNRQGQTNPFTLLRSSQLLSFLSMPICPSEVLYDKNKYSMKDMRTVKLLDHECIHNKTYVICSNV